MEKDVSFSPEAYRELQQRDRHIRTLEGELAEAKSLADELDMRLRDIGWLNIARGAIPALLVGVAIGMAIQLSVTPNTSVSTGGAAASAMRDTPSLESAAGVAQEYFDFAQKGDLNSLHTVVSAEYLRTAGGTVSFDKYWSSALAVDSAISPGRKPIVDSADSSAVWVQTAWRVSTKPEISVATVSWHVAWLKVIPEGSSYKIDERRSSAVKSCPSGELLTCTSQDPFSA
jgi:hypothetical protein